ncbi:MAG: hypothetical protein ACJ8BF_00360 [Gemmatimonadales bacterium]
MSPAARIRLASLLTFVLLGCSGDPGGPSSGTLLVTIQGLPSGSSAAVNVTGPNGFVQSLFASQSISSLTPGVYTIAASNVSVGATTYAANPTSQTVAVAGGGSASAFVGYSTPRGNLALTIDGVGTNNKAVVTVTGPGGFTRALTGTKTLSGLIPGDYAIAAQNVTATCGGTSYTAAPPNQTAAVVAGATANAAVTYTQTSGASLNLCIDGMYLNQSAQTYSNGIPLVANRNGLLRVFVVANQPNTPASTVQVQLRFYIGAALQSTTTISAPVGMTFVPTAADESSLSNSWNYSVAGGSIVSNLKIEAQILPGAVSDGNAADNLLAATPVVRTVPTLNVTFVPIIQGGLRGDVTDANKGQFLDAVHRLHPIDAMSALVRTTPITSTTVLLSNGSGWQSVLDQVDAIAVADPAGRYYYGVTKVSYQSGVAGVAYVSVPGQPARAALGWDYLQNGSASVVAAHELGHNWGRNHAPCGGPANVDPNYPEPDGSTGGFGYDISNGQLESPTSSDIMGYCDSKWISDYTYAAVLDYLTSSPVVMGNPSASQAVQPSLLVWGYVRDGQLTLHPAFEVNTRPSLPGRSGPYTIEGRAEDGSILFAQSFSPKDVADLPDGHQSFAFAIPLGSVQRARLASLHLHGRGQETVLSAARAAAGVQAPEAAVARRTPGGGVSVRWDHRAYPMAMIRDAENGEVMSIAEGGSVELPTSKRQVELILSDGVRSVVKRVPVAP